MSGPKSDTVRYWLGLMRRAARRPPRAVLRRLMSELGAEAERFRAPRRGRRFGTSSLLRATSAKTLDELWQRLAARAYVAGMSVSRVDVASTCPGEDARVIAAAERALAGDVDLLGSGLLRLDRPVDWSVDRKSGFRWPPGYARRASIVTPSNDADVKYPWELSRLQWLIPVGQAYRLTRDERYAWSARERLDDWISANPYALTVNWAIAMEPAIRVLTWTWLFHALHDSEAWRDEAFRSRFLLSLFLHADFVERNLEKSDVSGNHLTADAAGLVFAGLFFGQGSQAERWHQIGWRILRAELPRQVHPDGVDFEGSTAYHRLVLELFLLPALYREQLAIPTPADYRDVLIAMARFIAAYSRPDGSAPLWGDADDGRALPLGPQSVTDHRHVVGLVAAAWDVAELRQHFDGPREEVLWLLGPAAAGALTVSSRAELKSLHFPDAGVYVMRSSRDHVFVDAGPVGMRGRGGHSHNDCLSFEAMLDGHHLIVDPGAYVYTASYEWRNRFRSTAFHNTPSVDDEEQNRLVGLLELWSLRNDAVPTVEHWSTDAHRDVLRASHSGYERLTSPVRVVRTLALDKQNHRLLCFDQFSGVDEHAISVPYHLSASSRVGAVGARGVYVECRGAEFTLGWESPGVWHLSVGDGWISPSYGIKNPAPYVELRRTGALEHLLVTVARSSDDPEAVAQWARHVLEEAGRPGRGR